MTKKTKRLIRKIALVGPILGLALYFMPLVTLFWMACGAVDVSRNTGNRRQALKRYFLGNGLLTWLLSPLNLLIDLVSHKNPGVYTLNDFPDAYREEIEHVLNTFQSHKSEIISDIDAVLGDNARGMYVYRWYGTPMNDSVAGFNRDFQFIKTIAVSVFTGQESTSWHYGPLRLSIRVLYNLTPVDSENVYIETQNRQHVWRDNPLFMFDDTLFHRSVNEAEARRYNVFVDVARPSPLPKLIDALISGVSVILKGQKALFYKNWAMLKAKTP